ncbi:MAG TPA: hypothetical protein VHZ75_09100 [Solirubrobacteraceae bacterium]|jgi:hypothetical protein|nr:hypothetical protein [Solirubrobacteraceae bacterium]
MLHQSRTVAAVAVLGALLFLGGFAGIARADVASDLAVADSVWPGSPCVGRIVIVPDLAMPANFVGQALGILDLGTAWRRVSCEIALRPSYWAQASPVEQCKIVVHEAGHLANGPGHTHDGGVMDPDHGGDAYYEPCETIRARIVHTLDVEHPAHAVQCDRWQGRVLPCQVRYFDHAVKYRARTRGTAFAIERVR